MRWIVVALCALMAGTVAGCAGSGDSADVSIPDLGLQRDQDWIGGALDEKTSRLVGAELVSLEEDGGPDNPLRAKPCAEYTNPDTPKLVVICDLKPRYGPAIRCLTTEPDDEGQFNRSACESHPDKPGWEKACFAELNRYRCQIYASRGRGECHQVGGVGMMTCTGVGLNSRHFRQPNFGQEP